MQLNADWCNLVQFGAVCAIWYSLVQLCAVWYNLVQTGDVWCYLVQLGVDWCNLVQFGATWCRLVHAWLYLPCQSRLTFYNNHRAQNII